MATEIQFLLATKSRGVRLVILRVEGVRMIVALMPGWDAPRVNVEGMPERADDATHPIPEGAQGAYDMIPRRLVGTLLDHLKVGPDRTLSQSELRAFLEEQRPR